MKLPGPTAYFPAHIEQELINANIGDNMNAADKNAAQAAQPKRHQHTKAEMLEAAKSQSEVIRIEAQVPAEAPVTGHPADQRPERMEGAVDVSPDAAVLRAAETLTVRKHPNLYAALVAAQASIKAIMRDANHPKFGAYTSAENMIATSRTVLNKHGLAVIPAGDDIEKIDDLGLLLKYNDYILAHEGGQTQAGSMTVPVEKIGEKGSYQDAVLKADTIALSYYLRGVLQLPRYDDGKHESAINPKAEHFATPQPTQGVPGGAGTGAVVAPQTTSSPAPVAAQTSGALFMDDAKLNALREMIAFTKANESGVLKHFKVGSLALLSAEQFGTLVKMLAEKAKLNNFAAQFNAKFISFVPHPEPAPQHAAQSQPAQPQAGDQVLNEVQIKMVRQSLAARQKQEAELLAHFSYASVEKIPVGQLTAVMVWIRS